MVSAILITVFIRSPMFEERVTSAVTEVYDAFEDQGYETVIKGENFSFRLAHFYERLSYVLGSPDNYVFGAGFLTEDSQYAGVFDFDVGLRDEFGEKIQLDTGDILWSVLIMNLGLAGSALFMFLIFASIREMFSQPRGLFHFAGLGTLCAQTAVSVVANQMISPVWFLSTAMLIALSRNCPEEC